MASIPPVMLSAPNGDDPFTSPARANVPGPHRYASFDTQSFSLYNNNSPSQAKRALEAHLKDTERRIQDASRLGQTLLKQRKDLSERLKDVEHEKDDGEIGPELQKKLAELEKEYTEVGKESARAFLPKGRIVSQDFGAPSSPAVFTAASTASPSKFAAPSRRQRNQPANRVHDIEFATEISTSLLAQVRSLQAILAEKDDALRTTTAEKAHLEADIAGLVHRLKVLDESEQKFKEENWNLETQLQEIQTALKELTDKEQRLNQILKTTQAEKDAAQRELEELKEAHGKLADDHETVRKQNDSEIHGLRRDVANHESEKDTLQRKISELTSQNTELARAVASRWNSDDRSPNREFPFPEDDRMADRLDPDDSPIPSPSKTPARNGQLESETLRSSLTHAHRMIQNLKNNIHREKTEKIELRRMLQDARDEVENLRENKDSSVLKRRRSEQENIRLRKQQNRPDRLGATRSSTHEIIMDDDEWEDQTEVSPSRAAASRQAHAPFDHAAFVDRDSTDAFETANEREGTTTESEAFQTGVESLGADSSDDLTETEDSSRHNTIKLSRPSIYAHPTENMSYRSTASTDDEGFETVRTPVQQAHPKLRLRNVRGRRSGRASDLFNEGNVTNDSPASVEYSDETGTPAPHPGQSLMAELEGLSDDDEELEEDDDDQTILDTPSRVNVQSSRNSPETQRQGAVSSPTATGGATPVQQITKPQMVDSGMMTEPWEPRAETEHKSVVSTTAGAVGGAIAGVVGFALGKSTSNDKEEQAEGVDAVATPEEAARGIDEGEPKTLMSDDLTSPRREAIQRANMGTPRSRAPPAQLQRLTGLVSQQTHPVLPVSMTPPVQPQSQFAITTATTAETEPVSPQFRARELAAPVVMSEIVTAAETEPVPPPRMVATLRAPFEMSSIYTSAEIEPVSPPRAVQAPFEMSSISTAAETEPVSPVPVVAPSFAMSSIVTAAETEPVAPSRAAPAIPTIVPMATSSMVNAETEPQEPAVKKSQASDPFNLSTIISQDSEPVTLNRAIATPLPPRRSSRRPDFYTDAGFSPEIEDTQFFSPTESEYTDSGFSPERDQRDVIIPGTDKTPPGAAFFAAHPAVPPPVPQFPPRASSIRSVSPERRLHSSRSMDSREPTLIYADENAETSQKDRPSSSNSRTPFAAVSNNASSGQRSINGDVRPAYNRTNTSEMGTQTTVSADEIDSMIRNKHKAVAAASEASPRRSSETVPLVDGAPVFKAPRRPGSSGSIRKNVASPAPPLPSDHSIKIAAAAGKAPSTAQSSSSPGSMGPPSFPASAYRDKNANTLPPRSRTPSFNQGPQRNGPTTTLRPRVSNSGSARPTLEVPASPQQNGSHSRRSSVTSFASELDERFNISRANIYPEDLPPATDPRMITAITQTMIGEHLWKYTRKTGRSSEISGTRHRRFFWVHPYTRTLYWSEHDPSTAGAKQMKAKSVAIEAVRVISDDNAYPPGLHRKSLVVVTPGREIVFTAPTQGRHETWFNALSYLLLRTGSEREEDVNDTLGELTSEMTREEVDEFNPQVNNGQPPRSMSRNTARTRLSLSSYNSRTTNRTMSPARREYLGDVPTLAKRDGRRTVTRKGSNLRTPEPAAYASSTAGSRSESQNRDRVADPGSWSGSLSSRFGTLTSKFKSPGSVKDSNASTAGRGSFSSSRRSKSALSMRRPGENIYDASVVTEEDSDDELAEQIERERREKESGGALENVRACCGGKHDVGSLSRSTGRHAQAHMHAHGHGDGHGGAGASGSVMSLFRLPQRKKRNLVRPRLSTIFSTDAFDVSADTELAATTRIDSNPELASDDPRTSSRRGADADADADADVVPRARSWVDQDPYVAVRYSTDIATETDREMALMHARQGPVAQRTMAMVYRAGNEARKRRGATATSARGEDCVADDGFQSADSRLEKTFGEDEREPMRDYRHDDGSQSTRTEKKEKKIGKGKDESALSLPPRRLETSTVGKASSSSSPLASLRIPLAFYFRARGKSHV